MAEKNQTKWGEPAALTTRLGDGRVASLPVISLITAILVLIVIAGIVGSR